MIFHGPSGRYSWTPTIRFPLIMVTCIHLFLFLLGKIFRAQSISIPNLTKAYICLLVAFICLFVVFVCLLERGKIFFKAQIVIWFLLISSWFSLFLNKSLLIVGCICSQQLVYNFVFILFSADPNVTFLRLCFFCMQLVLAAVFYSVRFIANHDGVRQLW